MKFAFRYLSRQRVFTLINVLGLALSLACCIMLTRYLYREATVDNYQIDPETICETIDIIPHAHQYKGDEPWFTQIAGDAVVETCSYMPFDAVDIVVDSNYYFADLLMVDSTFLHFFDLQVDGDPHTLSRPDGALISRSLARKLFGNENPLGKGIKLFDTMLTVGGIFEEPGCKQSVRADIYTQRLSLFQGSYFIAHGTDFRWMRLSSVSEIERINHALLSCRDQSGSTYQLIGLAEGYRHHSDRQEFWGMQERCHAFAICNPSAINILTGVDLLILIVGIFNFVNLYMVLMQRRKREWAVRKVFGQKSYQLFGQVWVENLLQVVMAVFGAWLIVELTHGEMERLLGEHFDYSVFDLFLTLAFLLVIPLVAAIYPFVQYLIQPPVATLHDMPSGKHSVRTRLVFLSVQYMLSYGILICAMWFCQHFIFLQHRSDILRGDRVLETSLIHFNNNCMDERIFEKMFGIMREIQGCPLIEYFDTNKGSDPLNVNAVSNNLYKEGEPGQGYTCVYTMCTRRLFQLYEIPIVMGDMGLEEETPSDDFYFALNESAWKMMGFTSLDSAYVYGTWEYCSDGLMHMSSTGENGEYKNQVWGSQENPARVRAVVKDYYLGHASEGVKPMIFICHTNNNTINVGGSFHIKSYAGKEEELIDFLHDVQLRYSGNDNLQYRWFKDEVEELYRDDRRLASVCTIFAAIAILICCLGLLGLSMFDIRQRYREIAIRKANGAHRRDLYLLLGKKYLYVLFVTFLLSIPVTYVLIHRYTETFVESAPLSPWIYLIALVIVLLITFLTLIYQLEKAARVNVSMIVKTE